MNFDHEQLRRTLRAKREREGLTLRDVWIETGVSRSTLSRFERGGGLDADHAAVLAEFVGLSLSRLSTTFDTVSTSGEGLDSIEGLLRRDPKLRPSDAEGLMTIMRTAYRRAVEK